MIIDGWTNLVRYELEGGGVNRLLEGSADFFGPGADLYKTRSVADLIGVLDDAGVDRALLSTELPGSTRESRLGVKVLPYDEAGQACDESGRLKLIVGIRSVDEPLPLVTKIREIAADPRVFGLIVGAAGLGVPLTHRLLYPVYATAAEVGLPIVCNVGIVGPPVASKDQHPMLLEEICADFPTLQVIAAHGGHPWERLLVRLMMKFPNLSYLSSAYLPKYIDPAILDYMSSSRGATKCMFGSDWPMLEPSRCIAEARKLGLRDEVLDGYLGGNLAARWERN